MKTAGAPMPTNEYVGEHPVVRTHPETGRKALYVNVAHTLRFKDMTRGRKRAAARVPVPAPGAARVHLPLRAGVRARMAFWDNRCAQHNPVNDYHGYRRVMHRISWPARPALAGRQGRAGRCSSQDLSGLSERSTSLNRCPVVVRSPSECDTRPVPEGAPTSLSGVASVEVRRARSRSHSLFDDGTPKGPGADRRERRRNRPARPVGRLSVGRREDGCAGRRTERI